MLVVLKGSPHAERSVEAIVETEEKTPALVVLVMVVVRADLEPSFLVMSAVTQAEDSRQLVLGVVRVGYLHLRHW